MDADRLQVLLAAGRSLGLELDRDGVLRRLTDTARDLTGASHAGVNAFATGDSTPVQGDLGVPICVQGEPWGRFHLTGDELSEDAAEVLSVLAEWAAVALANAHLQEIAEDRKAELERTNQAFETATEVALALSGATETDRILTLVVERCRALLDARLAEVSVADANALVVAATSGAADDGSSARVAAPLSYQGRVLGELVVQGRDDPFTAQDERLVEAFAASAATAIATQRSATDEGLRLSIAASEAERRRWARELHDETLQELAGIRVLLAAVRRSQDPDRWRTAIDDAIELLGGGIQNLRMLITDLRPAALDEFGVRAAVEALAARVGLQHGLEVELAMDLNVHMDDARQRLTEEIESTIYRFVQEALSNVHKHAGVHHVIVGLTEDGSHVHVRVQDDGGGFETASADSGFGLLGMRERLALVNSRLEVESAPGGGTVVRARIPVVNR